MIKYNFLVEEAFRDGRNNKKRVNVNDILVVDEERLKELNAAKVGRVISAEYVADIDEIEDKQISNKNAKRKRKSKTKTESNSKKENNEQKNTKEDETEEIIDDSEENEQKEIIDVSEEKKDDINNQIQE